jgi:hypothetical protein
VKNRWDVSLRQILSNQHRQWIDAQIHQECEARDQRRLAALRASLPDDRLATLRRHSEEALATEGVARTRLGYEVLVKLKVDELLERGDLSADASVSQGNPDTTAVES